MVTTAALSYDGRQFGPVGAPAGSSVGTYHQDGALIWAEFAGTSVRTGRLVGTCGDDGVISAAYCMVTATGAAVAGECTSTPITLPDGRVMLTEHWRRLDGSSGVSHIEELR
jgi:hypothetical protein